jgi:hypothetical protein
MSVYSTITSRFFKVTTNILYKLRVVFIMVTLAIRTLCDYSLRNDLQVCCFSESRKLNKKPDELFLSCKSIVFQCAIIIF